MQRNSPGVARDGGPVVLRSVRATPSFSRDMAFGGLSPTTLNAEKRSLVIMSSGIN